MSDPLYRRELMRLAADMHGAGRLRTPDATGTAFNPACGDKVIVDLSLDGERVTAMAHDTRACILTQASASILGQSLIGADRERVEALRGEIVAMLGAGAGAPGKPFGAYTKFEGAVAYESRHRCVLLPVDAVLSAFDSKQRQ